MGQWVLLKCIVWVESLVSRIDVVLRSGSFFHPTTKIPGPATVIA